MKRTFKLQGKDGEVIGYVSKDNNDRLTINLNGFSGKLTSVDAESLSERLYVNVDDFVESIGSETAVVDCDRSLTLVIGSKSTVASISVEIYHPVAGLVFSNEFYTVEDVTGKVTIS